MITTDRNRLGRRLHKLREERGWTLNYLSDAFGIDKGNLSRIERGESRPSLATLRKLRDAYAVEDDVFLSWIDLAERAGGQR